jgi:phosphoglycerate dehydrogenase-like enzyme
MFYDVLCLRPEDDFARVNALPPGSFTVAYHSPNDPQIAALIMQARALVIPAVGSKLPPALFDGSKLKLVQVTGAGVDRLDQAAMQRLGIPVANVPGGSNNAVAEYVVTTASMLLRRFTWADAEIRKGHYTAFRARMLADNLPGLDGLTVGLIGLGVIGLAVAQAFQRVGCQVFYFDPAPRDAQAAAALGAQAVSLEQLLAMSDVISLHVPLLPATAGMIGHKELVAMKPGAILVQGSRGGIVDEAALAAVLQSGHLGGAAVDVYSTEPVASDNPLLALEGDARHKLLLTPHIAGVTRQSFAHLFRSAWANVERVLLKAESAHNRVY